MSLSTGARLGPYEIVAPLGAGGMGEVYRARDTKLQRDVALKVLPEVLARDAAPSDGSGSRLARFEREAQVLASLNHPNIAAIYGFKDTDGVPALVLEFVEGPTLAESAGPRAIEDALPIARQVADALEAAHEQGVVHRDLKPANVKVRPDGTVKVLDFGIAKLAEAAGVKPGGAGAEPTDLPTMTSASMQIGTILGTPAYMSPEQARGNPVDKRTDIWAFGCVLYEMLAGCRVFPGDNLSETLASVLRTQPDWHRLPSRTPPALHRLLRRCLEKDRGRRLPDVGVVRLEIDEALAELAGESAPLASGTRSTMRSGWVPWSMAVVLFATSVVLATLAYFGRETPEAPVIAFEVNTPSSSAPPSFSLSPDGKQLVDVSLADTGQVMLWVRSLDQVNPRFLSGTERASYPFWSRRPRTSCSSRMASCGHSALIPIVSI